MLAHLHNYSDYIYLWLPAFAHNNYSCYILYFATLSTGDVIVSIANSTLILIT